MMIRQLLLTAFTILLAINVTNAQETTAIDLPAKENFHLFLLVGQSNMAGRGKVTPADQEPIPRVLMLTKEGAWKSAVDPLHFDKPGVVGVGIGRTFASEVAKKHADMTIGLIPCAAGGSPIESWEPDGYHSQTKSHPYDDALRRTRLALKDGTLKGILWHQGESDSTPVRSVVYEEKLHALIAGFRNEFDSPRVPFIAGQLGQFSERPWNDARRTVDKAHRTLPEKIERTAFVSSDGLKHKGDQVHFSADAYRELGRRYAAAFLEISSE